MRTSLGLVCVLAASGCGKDGDLGNLGGLAQYLPRVSFDRLAVRDVDFEKIDTSVVLSVDNPYPLKVGLSSFSWDLSLGGQHVVGGRDPKGFQLDASGSSKVRVPVTLRFAEVIDLLDLGAGKDEVPFKVSGQMGFRTPLGEVKIPWTGKGRFPVLRAPKVALAGLRLDRLDPTRLSATLALDLSLTHEQATTLTFRGLDYGLSFGGHHVLDGTLAKVAAVEPGKASVVSLPITVNLVAVGATIADAIRGGGKLDVGFDAKVDVDTPLGVVPLAIDERGRLQVKK